MIMSLRASTSRLVSSLPTITPLRQLSTTSRRLAAPESDRKFGPTKWAATPADLLNLIGRDAPKRLGERADTWENLAEVFKQGTEPLKEAGVNVKDRKYYMQCLWRYSLNERPWLWVQKPKGPKKFRRWGGRVQNGVRIFTKQGKQVHATGW